MSGVTSSSPTPVTRALDGHRTSLSLHHRLIRSGQGPVRLDHVLSSTGGAYLIQERPDLEDIDAVRRTAERLESLVSRPVDPVLVATGSVAGCTVRGVTVVPEAGFDAWLAGLPATVDRSEMVLVNARVEKATEAWERRRRIPDWEVRARLGEDGISTTVPATARRPVTAAGPKVPRRGPVDVRGVASRVVAGMAILVLVMAVVGLIVSR